MTAPRVHVRREMPADVASIRRVNRSAFETEAEANLVDALRRRAQPFISFVALEQDGIAGHIAFSPVTLLPHPDLPLMGLAPMAVLPGRQRLGIGSALVRAGLDECRRLNAAAVVVVGHAGFYPRFGFVPASRFGLACEYDVPDDVFMAMELEPGSLSGRTGAVRYHAAFADL
jgi:putative acetyltransferase